ncbi:FtsX-like permease family protein [Kribbella sp. NPDC051137]|uniref:FtsX-like permease family protein n=1 Tax=Kribbella sp. NPDC051137 TaxID=3155045 RepID=UPI002F7F4484
MFLRRALRYRWAQALVLTGVSLLIGTCAVFGPWFARAVEQTVMTETLDGQRLPASWLIATRGPVATPDWKTTTNSDVQITPEQLDKLVPADLRSHFTPPVHGYYTDISWRATPADDPTTMRLRWRDGYCAQLTVVEGACPKAANEVIASVADKSLWGIEVGQTLAAATSGSYPAQPVKVVGFYRPNEARGDYWFGDYPTGHSRKPAGDEPGWSNEMFTERTTLTGNGNFATKATSDVRPLPGVNRLDDLDRLQDATRTVNGNAQEQLGGVAEVTSSLSSLIDRIQAERKQATTIIPLVMVQVALFAVVVLALALAAVVDQRRPEIALSRLRGSSARRTHRVLAIELGLPVLAGTLLGGLLGFGILTVVRHTWLRGGAPAELPWTVLAALGAAVVVAAAVVVLQVRGVVRRPISSLLRRVARRHGRAIGVADLCIIVFAVAGLVGALTGNGRGPLPVLTPALLALAAGLAFAHLLLPAAGLVSRGALRRGRLGLALGALQVSRRPAVTRIVAAVAVAAALLTFAGQAASVGSRNRDARSGYETGAEGVLRMNALYFAEFLGAVDKIDPDRHWLTPVVISRPGSPDALQTEMIEPDSFRRIAFQGEQLTDADGWRTLKAPDVAPIQIRGTQLTVTASTGPITARPTKTAGGNPIGSGKPKSVVLRANVVSHRDGGRYLVSFPPLQLPATKPVVLRAPVECQAGCDLLRLGVGRETADQVGLEGDLTISRLSTADNPAIKLGTPQDWSTVGAVDDDQGSVVAKPGGLLTIGMKSFGNDQFMQYRTVPAAVPALVTPEYRFDSTTTSPGIDGSPMRLDRIDRLRGPVNRYGTHTAVVDLESVRRLGGAVDEGGTDFEVWLNKAGMANVDTIAEQFTKAGLNAELVDRRDDRIASYGRSASALALQLTPVVGVAAWVLAIVVLLLTIVTSWRSRAQDYASLQLTGVPANATGRAARWEQTGPVALAVLLGTVCGLIGARVALPLIPLFATSDSPVPPDLHINWPVAIALWAAGTAVLAAVTLVLGTGVNRRSSYSRIREELT